MGFGIYSVQGLGSLWVAGFLKPLFGFRGFAHGSGSREPRVFHLWVLGFTVFMLFRVQGFKHGAGFSAEVVFGKILRYR